MNGRKTPDKKRQKFIEELRTGLSVSASAANAGVSRSAMYEQRKTDEPFAQAWDDAIEEGTDALEDEAIRRGKEGTEKPVFHQGKEVGTIREYSDTLLIFMLKGRRPGKFRERYNAVSLTDGGLSALLSAIDGQTRGVPRGENDNMADAA